MKKIHLSVALLTLSALALGGLSGCRSGAGGASYGSIASNPTPHLRGLVERPIDADRHMVYARNHNWRMFNEDLGRLWLVNHPSQLSPMPTVRTSGMPR